jgi:hypothetical protein
MPREKKETTAEFQKRTFPSRVEAAERKARSELDPLARPKRTTQQRARAEKVLAATARIRGRLGMKARPRPKGRRVPGSVSKGVTALGSLMQKFTGMGKQLKRIKRGTE